MDAGRFHSDVQYIANYNGMKYAIFRAKYSSLSAYVHAMLGSKYIMMNIFRGWL